MRDVVATKVKIIGSTLLIVAMLLIFLAIFKTSFAATVFLEPINNGSVGSWSVVGAATHSAAVADGVQQPSVPSVSSYVFNSANDSSSLFLNLGTTGSVSTVSDVTVWAYYNSGSNRYNCQTSVALFNDNETTAYSSAQSLPMQSANAWNSTTFSGLALSQAQLDALSLQLTTTKNGSGGPEDCTVFAIYAVITYSLGGTLSIDVIDGSGASVATPSTQFPAVNTSLQCQTTSATLGTPSERIAVSNFTGNGNWTASIAATGGPAALWSNGTSNYDYNDSAGTPAGCTDGADSDTAAGRLSVDPSVGSIAGLNGCGTSGLSAGSQATFDQASLNSITIISATSAEVACVHTLTGIQLTQAIPAETPANATPYSLNLTLTVVAN